MSTPDFRAPATFSETGRPVGSLFKWRLSAKLGADLLRLGVLATACMCLALVINQLREPPLPLVYASKQERVEQAVARTIGAGAPLDTGSPSTSEGTSQTIDLAEFQNLAQSKRVVVLDARPEIFHRLGHVPGALSLSREEFEQDYAKHRAFLEPRRDDLIAVYCSSASCKDSQMVANALVRLDYRHVLVFKGGWDEWTQAQLPEERR